MDANYMGRRAKRDAPGAEVNGENRLGANNQRQTGHLSASRRQAKQAGLFRRFARSSSSQQIDRGLRTAWKYAYFFHAAHRLTRYVE